jgi:hypothetical protein
MKEVLKDFGVGFVVLILIAVATLIIVGFIQLVVLYNWIPYVIVLIGVVYMLGYSIRA